MQRNEEAMQTAQGKQLLVVRGDTRSAFTTLTGNSTYLKPGAHVTIDSGPTLRAPLGLCRKLVDVQLRGTLHNFSAGPMQAELLCLLNKLSIFINNEEVFNLPSTSGDSSNPWHVLKHGYMDAAASVDDLASAYAEDTIDIVPDPIDASLAETDPSYVFPLQVAKAIPAGGSAEKSVSLSRFLLPDLLGHLPIGEGVHALRFEFGCPPTWKEPGNPRVAYQAGLDPDSDMEVRGLSVRLCFVDTAAGASSPVPP